MKFLQPAGLLVILALVVIFFFPRSLPDVAKPFRRRMRVFRENGELVRSGRVGSADDETPAEPADPTRESPRGPAS